MEEACLNGSMEIFMKENGSIIKGKDMEFHLMHKMINIKDYGVMIKNKDLDKFNMEMEIIIQDNFKMIKNMDQASLYTMEINMKVYFKMTNFMDKENYNYKIKFKKEYLKMDP